MRKETPTFFVNRQRQARYSSSKVWHTDPNDLSYPAPWEAPLLDTHSHYLECSITVVDVLSGIMMAFVARSTNNGFTARRTSRRQIRKEMTGMWL